MERREGRENMAIQDSKEKRDRPEMLAHKVKLDHKEQLDLRVLLLISHRMDAAGSILTPVDITVVEMS